ncbi:MAG: hypothetical protein KGL25_01715 [Gammaproteobacteria bacterium]|nr:hypothetical protein [Gammaproteobacteria bacterium]
MRLWLSGYRDTPEKHNPASGLKCARITKTDRPVIDPFCIQEADALIATIHSDWGEAQGNYAVMAERERDSNPADAF